MVSLLAVCRQDFKKSSFAIRKIGKQKTAFLHLKPQGFNGL